MLKKITINRDSRLNQNENEIAYLKLRLQKFHSNSVSKKITEIKFNLNKIRSGNSGINVLYSFVIFFSIMLITGNNWTASAWAESIDNIRPINQGMTLSFGIDSILSNFSSFWGYIVQTLIYYQFYYYFPLGFIGVWRWAVWGFKKVCSTFYRPIQANLDFKTTMSIISPVYKENPEVFKAALNSWQRNNPDEIVAVIDRSDTDCIKVFNDFARDKPSARLIVTSKQGKRNALADGIRVAKSEIVALVDSDVIWADNIRDKVLAPFSDLQIGGVTTRQNALYSGDKASLASHDKNHDQAVDFNNNNNNSHLDQTTIVEKRDRGSENLPQHTHQSGLFKSRSIWHKITDILWDMRNHDEWPAQTAMGKALTCLSGRTALYRRHILLPKLDEFLNEVLLYRRKESGEDKCLTRLIHRDGWKSYYQSSAQVYSPAAPDFKTFWGQKVRWTRNSYNSDLAGLWDGWVWKHPYLAFTTLDRFISSFTLLIGPISFAIALSMQHWAVAGSIVALWFIGRGIKIAPHLRRNPRDITMLPMYIGINFLMAVARIYALVTIREQKWIRATANSTKTKSNKMTKIKNIVLTSEIVASLGILMIFVL